VNLLDLAPADARSVLEEWVAARGEPAYRSRQIFPWLWQRPAASWAEATDLPVSLRAALAEAFPLARPTLVTHQRSRDGTVKFLWAFGHGGSVESVLIPDRTRRTLCISSQAGCAFGCAFCATGRMGFVRHLASWEIVAQVREMSLLPNPIRPSNLVFMGMGEPLHNWVAVDRALTILNDAAGMGIGARHITVSTVGLVPGLQALAARPEQFRVALSLHAVSSATRKALMPVERKYPLNAVVEALRQFPRRVTLEYVLIRDVNDRDEDAAALGRLAKDLDAHVNLLPLHPGGAPDLAPSPQERRRRLHRLLREMGVAATLRRSRGLDISAACGQLRLETEGGGVPPEDDTDVD
jgi:23S rRNA (adenine2503-C2)-methyltransferase